MDRNLRISLLDEIIYKNLDIDTAICRILSEEYKYILDNCDLLFDNGVITQKDKEILNLSLLNNKQ